VPEWSASYINYKGLKKFIKAAVATAKAGADADLAGKSCPKSILSRHELIEYCRVLLLP
jgi:hypothetical protein